MDSISNRQEISAEVEYWLLMSAIFFECFHIKKDPGPSWFLVNELLKHADGTCTVGMAAEALQGAGVARTKPPSDITKYSKHLQLLELLNISETALAGSRVFSVDTILTVTPKMESAVSSYMRRFLNKLFEPKIPNNLHESPRFIMTTVYKFMQSTYVPKWEGFLRHIAQIATEKTTGSDTPVFGKLRGSSEIFVLLLKLWEARLNGDDKLGFTVEELQDMHPRILVSSLSALIDRTSFLEKIGVIHNIAKPDDENSRFALVEKFYPTFELYAPEFVNMRNMLRSYLKLHVPRLAE